MIERGVKAEADILFSGLRAGLTGGYGETRCCAQRVVTEVVGAVESVIWCFRYNTATSQVPDSEHTMHTAAEQGEEWIMSWYNVKW